MIRKVSYLYHLNTYRTHIFGISTLQCIVLAIFPRFILIFVLHTNYQMNNINTLHAFHAVTFSVRCIRTYIQKINPRTKVKYILPVFHEKQKKKLIKINIYVESKKKMEHAELSKNVIFYLVRENICELKPKHVYVFS